MRSRRLFMTSGGHRALGSDDQRWWGGTVYICLSFVVVSVSPSSISATAGQLSLPPWSNWRVRERERDGQRDACPVAFVASLHAMAEHAGGEASSDAGAS